MTIGHTRSHTHTRGQGPGLRNAWKSLSSTLQYAVYGALFGLMFPVVATLGDLTMQRLPLTLHSLVQVQKGTPLHWMIDTAPFFLGLFASFAGRRQDRLAGANQELERQVQARGETADRLRETLVIEQEQRARLEQANAEIEMRIGYEQEQRRALQNILDQVRKAAYDLDEAAAEISAATAQQAAGATEQASAISQTATSVDEVRTIAEQSMSRAQQIVSSAQHTAEVSDVGQIAMQDTVESLGRIKTFVETVAQNIVSLSEQTQRIGEIVTTVNDIASQSNLLALNAAVEAARAGEQGKGFAVVAQEVRDLADRSRQATTQIKTILADIQEATETTEAAAERGTKDVDDSAQLAIQAQEALSQLAQVIGLSTQLAEQMAVGGQQQANGMEQIAVAMQSIDQATTQNMSNTRQTEQSAQQLGNLARSLTEIVEQHQT